MFDKWYDEFVAWCANNDLTTIVDYLVELDQEDWQTVQKFTELMDVSSTRRAAEMMHELSRGRAWFNEKGWFCQAPYDPKEDPCAIESYNPNYVRNFDAYAHWQAKN